MGSGIVYVVHNNWIQNPDAKKGCKTYKIGITTKSVSARYYGLDLKMPSEFVCDFAYKFDNEQYIAVEKKLHKILNQLNVGGEWYDLNDDTLDGVHDVCKQNGGELITDAIEKEITGEKRQGGESPKRLSGIKSLRKEYWTYLVEYFNQHGISVRRGKIVTSNPWYCIWCLRNSGMIIILSVDEEEGNMCCSLKTQYVNAKKTFLKLKEEKNIIEKEIGEKLEWDWEEENKCSYISFSGKGNIKDREQWEKITKWFKKYYELFYKAFLDRAKKLKQ
jgi:hypothetical protein